MTTDPASQALFDIPSPGPGLPWWLPSGPAGESLTRAIEAARAQDRSALATYLPVGFPDRLTNLDAFHLLAQSADVIELGIPHAEGVLDGPVIREASRTALDAGFKMTHLFDAASELSASADAALLVMSYWQPLHAYGPERWAAQAASVGVAGVIVPDLPYEASASWRATAQDAGLASVPLVSHRTQPDRLAAIADAATGMVYAPATTGLTGSTGPLSGHLPGLITRLRSLTTLPVAAGIGISTPEQARTAAAWADVVVVGSAVIRRMQAQPRAQIAAAAAVGRDFAAALRRAPHLDHDGGHRRR
ncbi:tryptophan synthase subunit alpha [Streptomyces sp. NPDC004579]|uniref:tryptophan synthase subunit alpha n=1 Tax=Streptomyces sp. NPDC004579 TaxID=3154667 RepID=UPI0033B686B6